MLLEDLAADEVAPGLWRTRVRMANRGAFPTNDTNGDIGLRERLAPRAEFHPADGVERV